MALVFLANLGKLIEEAVGYIVERLKDKYKKRYQKNNEQKEEKVDFEMGGVLFLVLFLFYTALGVTGICFLEKLNLIDGMFSNFISITAIDAITFLSAR